MADTFTWVPTSTGGGTIKDAVKRVQFGDGYRQTSPDGINPRSRSYQLTFTGSKTMVDQIVAFLDAHVGRSFLWQCPRGLLLFECTAQGEPFPTGLMHSVTATFEQTFQP
ncbi:phage tail protein [Stenotrophomonas maltophilia]|uniref:phage tail protein n=1 Tax=Stenotrophomonas maltophilia TaxID=40324 RepID=UPI001F53B425|nr:phage tail protein [Stenotrophomonas maltophilia]MCI1148973.1 phage tail protein [Stenotrophomonas maltophilia]